MWVCICVCICACACVKLLQRVRVGTCRVGVCPRGAVHARRRPCQKHEYMTDTQILSDRYSCRKTFSGIAEASPSIWLWKQHQKKAIFYHWVLWFWSPDALFLLYCLICLLQPHLGFEIEVHAGTGHAGNHTTATLERKDQVNAEIVQALNRSVLEFARAGSK